MITVSKHLFADVEESNQISISIIEVIEEEYGLHVWPCSIALAEYIWQQKARFTSSEVLELGAGTGLPGILAAKLGAHVTLTDLPGSLKVIENLERNCKENGVDCQFHALTWADWDSFAVNMRPNIILGADILYNSKDFDDLFATVAFLLHKSIDAVFITAYEPRSGHHSIKFLMAKWGLKCTKLLDAHDILPLSKFSLVSMSIEIVEIKAAEFP